LVASSKPSVASSFAFLWCRKPPIVTSIESKYKQQ
jgi:hypothetical protein